MKNCRSDMIQRQEKLLQMHPNPVKFNLSKNEHIEATVQSVKIEHSDEEIILQHQEDTDFVDCTLRDEPGCLSKSEIEEEANDDKDEEDDEYEKENSDEDFELDTSSFQVKPREGSKRDRKPNYKPTNEDHVVLLKKFKQLLKKNKSKQIPCPDCFKVSVVFIQLILSS